MTDLDDLIARLRGFGPSSAASPADVLAACHEAADELGTLRAQRDQIGELTMTLQAEAEHLHSELQILYAAALKHQ